MKKLTTLSILATVLILNSCTQSEKIGNYIDNKKTEKENKQIIEELIENKKNSNIDEKVDIVTPNVIKRIPSSFLIEADFICQAPLQTEANWKYHEESCEEAALLQTINYENSIKQSKLESHEEILRMIEWQNTNFNGHHDIYADKVKELAQGFYGLKDSEINIIYDASIEDIKTIISSGHPVIAPVTSKYLKNPNYPHPGYHMLQVIGYNEDKIITNDNGTRKGKNYLYSITNFEKALNDAGGDILYLTLEQK